MVTPQATDTKIGFAVESDAGYSPRMDPAFRQRLKAAGLDHDAVNVIVRVGRRADVPVVLRDQWAAQWTGQPLQDLVNLSPADRQHALARQVDDFLQGSANLRLRANYAAIQAQDADLRTVGELAVDLLDVLTAFGRDVMVPTVSPFTGKVRYVPLTDVDVATDKAIVEVSTQPDATGKVAQLAVLMGAEANPNGLPVYHFLPNVDIRSAGRPNPSGRPVPPACTMIEWRL